MNLKMSEYLESSINMHLDSSSAMVLHLGKHSVCVYQSKVRLSSVLALWFFYDWEGSKIIARSVGLGPAKVVGQPRVRLWDAWAMGIGG